MNTPDNPTDPTAQSAASKDSETPSAFIRDHIADPKDDGTYALTLNHEETLRLWQGADNLERENTALRQQLAAKEQEIARLRAELAESQRGHNKCGGFVVELSKEITDLKAALKESVGRDGSWLDKWGSCRVCGGEIPHGHTNNCDIFKLEQTETALRAELAACQEKLRTAQQPGSGEVLRQLTELASIIGLLSGTISGAKHNLGDMPSHVVEAMHDAIDKATRGVGLVQQLLAQPAPSAGEDAELLDWLDKRGLGRKPRAWSIFEYADNIRDAIRSARQSEQSKEVGK